MKHAPHIEALRRYMLEDLEDRGLEDDDIEDMQVEDLRGEGGRVVGYKLTVGLAGGGSLTYEMSVKKTGLSGFKGGGF